MSIIPQINPFGPYVKQYLTPLQGEITEWLAGFEKTLDDVAWWEINITNVSPSPFLDGPKWKYRITVAFAGSDEKHEKIFLVGMKKKYLE